MRSSQHQLIPASVTAQLVHQALKKGREGAAIRVVTEAVSRLLGMPEIGALSEVIVAIPPTTEDSRYDALIGTGYAFAMQKHGLEPSAWMLSVPALPEEWVVDGGDLASAEFRAFIRESTPPIFLAKGILIRERDLITA